MSRTLALVRANWLVALSYRLDTFFAFMGLVIAVVPLYFISGALQPMMLSSIRVEAKEYFGFLMIGIITYSFVQNAVGAVHTVLAREISTGSFEALLSTPTSMAALIGGMVGQSFSMTLLRGIVLFGFSWALGAHIVWHGLPMALGALALLILAYLPFGLFAAALVLTFRTTGPFPQGVVTLSALMGGVYYPTTVIPSWLQQGAAFVPLTYGLRALRRALLDGAPASAVTADLGVLALFVVVLLATSIGAFQWALQRSKFTGTLAQY